MSHYLEILFQSNGATSPSPWFIVVFCRFYLFPPHGWVLQLVGITDNIGSTFLSNYIIIFCTWPVLARFCSFTLSRNFIPAQWHHITVAMVYCYFFLFFCFLLVDECDHSLWSLITSEVLFWAIILSLYIIILIHDCYWIDCAVSDSL